MVRHQGKQLEYGWHRGNYGFPLTVCLLHFLVLLRVAAEFVDATSKRTPACVLPLRGWPGGWEQRERWERKIGQTHHAIGVITTLPPGTKLPEHTHTVLTTMFCHALLDALFIH